MHLSPVLGRSLQGAVTVPADKSITHRSILFGAIANGMSRVRVVTLGRDNFASIRAMTQLGVQVTGSLPPHLLRIACNESLNQFSEWDMPYCELQIQGKGKRGLKQSAAVLDCGNSGTTSRLLCGLLSGQHFSTTLTGDHSLVKRPFRRVTEPLSQMDAKFSSDMLPITISGAQLKPISYHSPQASAQVKSALMLAGLYAQGATSVVEPRQSRDHSERMLSAMGAKIKTGTLADGSWQVEIHGLEGDEELSPLEIEVPGDFSSAGFFLVAGAIVPGARVEVRDIGFNPTRTGLYDVLAAMGAEMIVKNKRIVSGEPVADILVCSTQLKATTIAGDLVVRAIDEIPILAVAAAVAEGTTTIRDAAELRVKESDRLSMTAAVVRSFGGEVEELPDGLVIHGNPELRTPRPITVAADLPWHTVGDHRISMAAAVFEYLQTGGFTIYDPAAVETSFPSFLELFEELVV